MAEKLRAHFLPVIFFAIPRWTPHLYQKKRENGENGGSLAKFGNVASGPVFQVVAKTVKDGENGAAKNGTMTADRLSPTSREFGNVASATVLPFAQ
jgi:hypothetical protein